MYLSLGTSIKDANIFVTWGSNHDFRSHKNINLFYLAIFRDDTMALKFESFDGGRDSKERLLQGLLVAATKTPDKSLVVVFTDNGSKDLKLKDEILVSGINLVLF